MTNSTYCDSKRRRYLRLQHAFPKACRFVFDVSLTSRPLPITAHFDGNYFFVCVASWSFRVVVKISFK